MVSRYDANKAINKRHWSDEQFQKIYGPKPVEVDPVEVKAEVKPIAPVKKAAPVKPTPKKTVKKTVKKKAK